MRTETISVYLLKPTVVGATDAVNEGGAAFDRYDFSAGTETRGVLFVQEHAEHLPTWLRLLGSNLDRAPAYLSQSTSAVLVLTAAGRHFALVFGRGTTMLDKTRYERRFGLKVALNALKPDALRGAQARSFGGVTQQTNRQLARVAAVEAFGLDWQREMVTALDGTTSEDSIGKRLNGRDHVRITLEFDVDKVGAICADLLALSEKRDYKANYPLIDNVEEIVDDRVDLLNDQLAARLGQVRRH
jgi:uncharacterized protein (TIGR04141 family)